MDKMYKSLTFYGAFGNRTGYQIHATELCNELEKLIPVYRNEQGGEAHITLIDSVSIQNINDRLPYPSFIYNVWEATEQPQWFIDKLKFFDGLFVASEWQKACSIAQGIPEEFISVIPEGVNPELFKPSGKELLSDTFDFLVVGQWQPRKSTLEIVQSFLKAFPDNPNVRLYLSTDTLFPSDNYNSTEERLVANGITDERIIPLRFEDRDAIAKRYQNIHCHVSCARSEGFSLPICFPTGTKIVTPIGNINIENIEVNSSVFTHNGEPHKVLKTMKRKYNDVLCQISIYGDYLPINCTPEHPVFAIKRPNKRYKKSLFYNIENITPEWIPAKEIEVGDTIIRACPQNIYNNIEIDLVKEDQSLKYNDNYVWYSTGYNSKGEKKVYNRFIPLNKLGFLLGWYIAEGSNSCKKGIEFSLSSKEQFIADEILKQAKLLFNADGSYFIKENKLRVNISSTILSKLFSRLCGVGAENKRIPEEILYGNIHVLSELINSYVDGDGYKTNKRIFITTVSETLARQISIAALRLGYKSNIQNNGNRKGNHNEYVVHWGNNNKNGRHSNKSWWSKYGIASLVKGIKSIQYSGYVHNIEVEKNNSYLLLNASVHNCESMAVGVPTIVCDYSGSTEYAEDAIKVPVKRMIEPFGIYGNWKVPGQWCEPDYDVLVSQMKDVYDNYDTHKKKALKTSEYIRDKFSWKAIAKRTYDTLSEFANKEVVTITTDHETEIKNYANSLGYEITSMRKNKTIFLIDCHPTSQEKIDTLVETINQVKEFGYPILVVSHCAIPQPAIELADYYIYDKRDILSGDDKPIYGRPKADGTIEKTFANIPCHALAWLHNIRNGVDFCKGKFDWIYQMSSDVEVDIHEWMYRVKQSDKSLIGIRWEEQAETITGQLIAGKTELMDKIYPHIETWDEFARMYGVNRFCCEKEQYKRVRDLVGLDNVEFLSIQLGNRFNQVDVDAWDDEEFQSNFIDGPFLNIIGVSNREYDVVYTNPIDGDVYQVRQKTGMWSRPDIKYYRDWTIKARLDGEIKHKHTIDLKDKNVIISMGSKALGDTLAWIPYVEEFRKKHKCNVYCSSWWNNILNYPKINFIKPGDVVNDVYASYEVGCYDDQLNKNVINWRLTPLQKVASDILGLEYEPLRTRLKYKQYKGGNGNKPKPYICFSEFSTMQNKLWNREGAWQKIINYINSFGYDCVSISAEMSNLTGIINHNGQSIEQTLTDVSGCEFYIGLNAGPSWIAYSLNKPCIMITGVSEEWNDFPTPYRIAINNEVCGIGCFNDPSLPINRDWEWCPREKNYICTREITEEMVIEQIDKLIGEKHETYVNETSAKKKGKDDRFRTNRDETTGISLRVAP